MLDNHAMQFPAIIHDNRIGIESLLRRVHRSTNGEERYQKECHGE